MDTALLLSATTLFCLHFAYLVCIRIVKILGQDYGLVKYLVDAAETFFTSIKSSHKVLEPHNPHLQACIIDQNLIVSSISLASHLLREIHTFIQHTKIL